MPSDSLEAGFELDRRWHWLRGEMEESKRSALLALGRVLADARVPYAIIGGVALQVHQREPRTTLDIDVAVIDIGTIPREKLTAAGFRMTGRFAHSENWEWTDGTPVQFTSDPALARAVRSSMDLQLDDVTLRIIAIAELLHEKLRAGSDPARRQSKRLQDLADAASLLEADPQLRRELSEEELSILLRLPG